MNKKESLLALLKVFERYTDTEHPLTRKALEHHLAADFDIEIDRKTFGRHLQTLNDFGYEIIGPKRIEGEQAYYLNNHLLEKYEAHLLVNTLYASHFLEPKASQELIEKIFSTQSRYYAKELREVNAIHNLHESPSQNTSKEFFLTIEMILEAIAQHQEISFQYMKYDLHKNMIPKRDAPYIVRPYNIVYNNDNIYLLCGNPEHQSISHFRIEKMKDVQIINASGIYPELHEPPYTYIRHKTKMYNGKEECFILKCDLKILDYILEECGMDTLIQSCDDNHFYAYVNATRGGMTYLTLQYLRYIEVLEPADFRDEIKTILKEALERHS